MADAGVLGGVSLGRLYPGDGALASGLLVAVTETTTRDGRGGARLRPGGGDPMSMLREGRTTEPVTPLPEGG